MAVGSTLPSRTAPRSGSLTTCSGARRRQRRAIALATALVAAVLMLVAAPPMAGPTSASADPAPTFTSTVKPTADLIDGQTVVINLKATAGNNVYGARAAVCRAGVTYRTSTDSRPDPDAAPNGPNCPLQPISTSAQAAVEDDNLISTSASPAGATLALRVGTGPITWTGPSNAPESLTCDPDNPCSLVVEVYGGPKDGSTAPIWVPLVVPLTYAVSDPLATCGGASAGVLSTGSSDALIDAWTRWTLDQCKQPGQTGAATEASFVGEGQAVQQFDAGTLDLAYTSGGYNTDIGLLGTAPPGPNRPAVAVPVGIGAVTLGVGNGYGLDGNKVPYPTIDMTADEVATVVGSGQYMSGDQQAPVTARNPLLSPFFAPSTDLQAGVPSGASSSTWYLSHYLSTVAGGAWKVPDVGAAGTDVNAPRGVFDDFGTATPDFNLLTTYTGRPALDRLLFAVDSNQFLLGGVFVVSDLTTARAETLTPVAIQSQAGWPFVAPTPASMDAAVADMQPDPQGLLQPATTPSDPNAYPLAYVEYALVPTQPLVDASCTPRPASQAQLIAWLHYVTTDGQRVLPDGTSVVLPDGLAPLTPALATQAAAAIAKVGATPNTCTPPGATDTASDSGSSGSSATDTSSSGSPGSDSSGVPAASGGAGGAASAVASGPGKLGGPKTIAARVGIPPYGGAGSASALATVLALIGIVALVTLAARYTSGFGRAGTPGDDGPDGPDAPGDDPGVAPP